MNFIAHGEKRYSLRKEKESGRLRSPVLFFSLGKETKVTFLLAGEKTIPQSWLCHDSSDPFPAKWGNVLCTLLNSLVKGIFWYFFAKKYRPHFFAQRNLPTNTKTGAVQAPAFIFILN